MKVKIINRENSICSEIEEFYSKYDNNIYEVVDYKIFNGELWFELNIKSFKSEKNMHLCSKEVVVIR